MAFNPHTSPEVHRATMQCAGTIQRQYPDANAAEIFQMANELRKELEGRKYAKEYGYAYKPPENAVVHPKVQEKKQAVGTVLAALLNKNPAP